MSKLPWILTQRSDTLRTTGSCSIVTGRSTSPCSTPPTWQLVSVFGRTPAGRSCTQCWQKSGTMPHFPPLICLATDDYSPPPPHRLSLKECNQKFANMDILSKKWPSSVFRLLSSSLIVFFLFLLLSSPFLSFFLSGQQATPR